VLRSVGTACHLLPIALAIAATPAPAVPPGRVAMTFDDLPLYGRYPSASDGEAVTVRLLAGLRRNHWPAIGFVNEMQLAVADRAARIGMLERWLDAGMELGNHSYSHLSLDRVPVETYIADVARGGVVTSALLADRGRRERRYRYPYLETGRSAAVRARFEGWLAAHHYRVAPVTMENSDWQFADPYDDALRHGRTTEAGRIRDAYLAYSAAIVPWYRKAAGGLLGREPAFVFLLHASRLNADSVDALDAILRTNRLRAVRLKTAMRDPAYRIADTYVGPDGDEWVTRWAMTLHKDLPWASLPTVPADIRAWSARLDAAAPKPVAPPVR
jgi:peptidoglycan/xylan/chitin deacetylase (PgdA/CDA1 family)